MIAVKIARITSGQYLIYDFREVLGAAIQNQKM